MTKYLVFYHNYYVEAKGPEGDCKYHDILKTFSGAGYSVISELRPKDVPAIEYSKKAASDIRRLMDCGVSPGQISVAGHSKGAVIALRVAAILAQPEMKYVILAGCGIRGLAYPEFSALKGEFLSVYASSDQVASSCQGAFKQAREGLIGTELVLESAAGHQTFFRPTEIWTKPVLEWLASA